MTATTAGFRISVRGSRVYLIEAEPSRDPGMSCYEAKELASRLLVAADQAAANAKEGAATS